MNNEDRKYLRSVRKIGPSFEVFSKMAQILTKIRKETDRLGTVLDVTLLEAFKRT